MKGLRYVAIAIVALVFVLTIAIIAAFTMANGEWVVVRLPMLGKGISEPLSWLEIESHLGGLIIGAFLAGCFFFSVIILVPLAFRRSFDRRRQKRQIENLEGELSDLRNLPFEQPAPYEDIEDEGLEKEPTESSADDEDEALLIAAIEEESLSARS